jgi:hypothetical protein
MVNLIRDTPTNTGLKVKCRLDKKEYKLGKKINDDLFDIINITKNNFQDEWNYKISPRN